MNTTWSPQGLTKERLDAALAYVRSKPYKVSLRQCFYHLKELGLYTSKDDYRNSWVGTCSKARNECYGEWRPDTLIDNSREPHIRGEGIQDIDATEWAEAQLSVQKFMHPVLDTFFYQDCYIEIWVESRGMGSQFAHLEKRVPVIPMGGKGSIPVRYEAARRVAERSSELGKRAVVLFFGDRDDAGDEIAEMTRRTTQNWALHDFRCEFEFVHCGLTAEQAVELGIGLDEDGECEWEALSDEQAKLLIVRAMDEYWCHDGETERNRVAKEANAELRRLLDKAGIT